jgi:hypothetical protein
LSADFSIDFVQDGFANFAEIRFRRVYQAALWMVFEAELSKYVWKLNSENSQYTIKWSINKSRKSFVAKLGDGKRGFLGVRGPQKSWRNNIRVRVRALTVMDSESHVRAGLPRAAVVK